MQSLAPGDRHARRRSWYRPTAFPPARRVALPSPTPRWRDRGRLGGFQAVSRKLGERRWSTAPAAWEADCRPQHIPGPATSWTARVPGCCDAGAPLLGSGGAAPSSLRPPLAVLGEILETEQISFCQEEARLPGLRPWCGASRWHQRPAKSHLWSFLRLWLTGESRGPPRVAKSIGACGA